MRKTIMTLVAALAVAFTLSSPASAGHIKKHPHKATIVAGAVVGTVVGIGLYETWWSSKAWTAGTSGAVAGGFVAGVGTIALIHAVTTPCQGFQALMMINKGCKNGVYTGPKRQAFLFW